MHNLLLWQNDIIDIHFDYVTIVLGTETNKNEILSSLKDELRPDVMENIELKKLYETTELMKKNFSSEFEHFVKNKANRKKKGYVIFDELMSELSECGLLLDLFSTYSSHYDLTTIHIMQNVFFKAGGKHSSDHVTIYRNTHVPVLFKNPLDNTVIHTITQRISREKKYGELVDMLHHVLDHHRYIVSLVKDSIVGNVFAPIVRVVGLEDKPKSETIHREFTVPHYLPLRSSSFNEVVLELTDGMGNSMKFNEGNSVAVFHFKKKGKI